MTRIGSYEAKTKFAELLERIGEGESFIITRHGHPAAKLGPATGAEASDREEAIATLEEIRGHALLGCSLDEARGGGRM